jgi:hypothetical protein
MIERARITASYSRSCFCEGPFKPLPEGPPVPYRPRFHFKRAARAYAVAHGLENLIWNTADKAATAELIRPCVHRQAQIVRLGWRLVTP